MNTTHITLRGTVRYDGTTFAGWQIQPGQRTVQGALEASLAAIAGEAVPVLGAGRTDAGVHALAQAFACQWPMNRDWRRVPRALSSMLAPHIRIESLEEVSPDFHPIRDAKSKRYGYTLSLTSHPDPFSNAFAWHVRDSVDMSLLESLLPRVTGRHDFAGYCCAGSSVEDTVRTIHRISLHRGCIIGPVDQDNHWHLVFHGEGFLYKMVRNLVGTFVDISRGHLPESALTDRLAAPGPYRGFTAPSRGLVLMDVEY